MSRSFDDQFADDQVGFIADLDDRDTTAPVLVAFGGLNHDMGMPHFEFFNMLQDVSCSKVFIRDLDQVFYQRGIRGLGDTVPKAADRLRELLVGRSKVAFVGNSAGGFGAMLFGALIGVDIVVAFAPETFVSRTLRFFHRDARWPDEIAAMYNAPRLRHKYLNLRRVLAGDNGQTVYEIYYPKWNKVDSRHALRMASLPRVTLRPNHSARHGVIRDLREDGSLELIITGLI